MFVSKKILIIVMVVVSCTFILKPKAKAIDPVTIAILAPYAIEAAETMAPYIQQGLVSGAQGTLVVAQDAFEILYLPLGVFQSTVGMPFGAFGSGVSNISKGCIAPFKLAIDAALLPIKFLGVM